MKKKIVKNTTMLNLKGFLILLAFALWIYVMMNISDSIESMEDAIYSYGSNTFFIICIVYILLLILEFFVDIEDIDA